MNGMTLAQGSWDGQEIKVVNISDKYISFSGNLPNPNTAINWGWAQSFTWYDGYWYPNVQ